MYLLLTDETNMPKDPGARFFVYGGLFFPIDHLIPLHDGIGKVRADCGYRPGDRLKFETNARPDWVTIENARAAKERVVQLCIDLGCLFIAYIVLHDIARDRTQDELVTWGANSVIAKFDAYLWLNGEHGIVAVDRLPIAGDYRYLSDRFSHGLTLPTGTMALTRIKLLAATCINASHASSAMDIVLGCFRYCINQPKNVEVARTMMTNVTKLIWADRDGDDIRPFEKGILFRPRYSEIRVPAYKAEYDRLVAHINSLLEDDENDAK